MPVHRVFKHCYIALGSNLDSPSRQIEAALQAIDELQQVSLIQCSSLYESTPMGPQDQPNYINAVVEIKTSLAPEVLLDQLQTIESAHGRQRSVKWGARTLDLDILLYGDRHIDTDRLCIPHPGMRERNFVIHPLYEIAPELQLPDGTALKILFDQSSASGIKQLE